MDVNTSGDPTNYEQTFKRQGIGKASGRSTAKDLKAIAVRQLMHLPSALLALGLLMTCTKVTWSPTVIAYCTQDDAKMDCSPWENAWFQNSQHTWLDDKV